MFLVVVDEPDLRLELFTTILIAEFADMSSGFPSLTPVSCLDGHGTTTKGTVSAPDGDKSRILLVSDKFSDEADSGIGIFHSAG